MRETSLTQNIIRYAKSQRCFAYKQLGSVYGKTGMPDVRLLVPVGWQLYAVPVYIEVKKRGEEPSPLQKKRLRDLNKAGAIAVWVDNLQDVKDLIQKIREQTNVFKHVKDGRLCRQDGPLQS